MGRKTKRHLEVNVSSPPRGDVASAALMVQFLTWVADRPRTRNEVMDAWRSTCPRLTAWEDAIIDGLVQLDAAGQVTVTALGRALLERQPAMPGPDKIPPV